MNQFTSPAETSFSEILNALLDPDAEITQQHLFRLSDLEGEDKHKFEKCWSLVPLARRLALLEEMERLAEDNHLLSYEIPCRLSLTDTDPQIRFFAVRGLLPYDPVDLLKQLTRMLREDPDENVRAVCAANLGRFIYLGELDEISAENKEHTVDCLLNTARNEASEQVRQRALESLGFTSNSEIHSLIKEAYQSGRADRLTSALFAMGRSYDARWIPSVITMLDHQMPAVRFEATRAAGELEIKDAAERLTELLEDTSYDIRMASAWSLSKIGGEGIKEALEELLNHAADDAESDFLQEALDNLLFNEDMELFDLMEFSGEEMYSDE